MLSQEEYMDVQALKRQGWTIAEIAGELGYHPATISNWLRNGGPAGQARRGPVPARDRRAMGRPHRRAHHAAVAATGHERVRDHQDGGLRRFLPIGVA